MATASLLSSSNRFLLPILLSIPTQIVLSNIEEVPTIPILAAYTITNVSALTYQLTTSTGTTASEIVLNLTGFNAVFLTCFILLTLVRRVYLHPLCKFPGQKRAAATRLWEAWLNSEGINGPQ